MKKLILAIVISGLLVNSQISAAGLNSKNALNIKTNHSTGHARFISGVNNQAITIKNQYIQSLDRAIINQFSGKFGISGLNQELRTTKQSVQADNHTTIRYQQYYKNVPIIGGELVANTNSLNQLNSISGETSPNLNLDTQATLSASDASAIALNLVSKLYTVDVANLNSSIPKLSIYDAKLIGPGQYPATLVWRVEVTAASADPIRELVLIDANNGVVHLNFNQIDTALNRTVYTARWVDPNLLILPAAKPADDVSCTETTPCLFPNTTIRDIDADFAKIYSGHTYNFYKQNHNRNSIDGALNDMGMALISTVHIGGEKGSGLEYRNAFWNGRQMGYGEGFSQGLDVVAHELTHGVTQYESNLFYHHQSGAISESFSDVWGELIDQTYNPNGTKWIIGDELVRRGVLTYAVRNMSNPEVPLNPRRRPSPEKMTSSSYYSEILDNGGVHYNSAINNKAAVLMTDGGTVRSVRVNGALQDITVIGLGITKVAKIYYEVQTKLLFSGSNYKDLYTALITGCTNLANIPSSGIVTADCIQVTAAVKAVEMNLEPTTTVKPRLATLCAAGTNPSNIFMDDFESGTAKWLLPSQIRYETNQPMVSPWAIKPDGANNLLWGVAYDGIRDFQATMRNSIVVPATGTTYLHFKHQFFFETFNRRASGQNNLYRTSGGVLEYSTNNGSNWTDAGNLINSGLSYNATNRISIVPNTYRSNPINNRRAFMEHRYDVNSTRLNLSSLAGRSVKFRWRIGGSALIGSTGWFVDDVRIYQCNTTPVVNRNPIIRGLSDRVVNQGDLITLDASTSSDPDNQPITFSWTQNAGVNVLNLSSLTAPQISFVIPADNANIVFQLTVSDNNGGTATKTVTLTVNQNPVAKAGVDLSVKISDTVVVTGSATDQETLPANLVYNWAQVSGLNVTLINANTPVVSFVAPSQKTAIVLQLTVSDANGGSSSDSVKIDVLAPIVNQNPIVKAGVDLAVKTGETVAITGSATDVETLPVNLIYSWTQVSGLNVTLINANTPKVSFVAPSQKTTVVLQLTVSDANGGSSSDTVNINVTEVIVNQNPVVQAGADFSVNINEAVAIKGSATDQETLPANLLYNWTQVSGLTVSLVNANTPTVSFAAPSQKTTVVLQLTVNDANGGSSSDSIIITVTEPVVIPQPDQKPIPDTQPEDPARAGCSLSPSAPFDPMLVLLVLIAFIFTVKNKARKD